jgi:DUF4097 and DUF4098 domain-containing protein YvlB
VKSNLFPRVFVITAIATVGFLALTSYASKKALAADPQLLNRLQSKYNVRINGFGVSPANDVTQDSWTFPSPIQKIKVATVSGDIRVMESDKPDLVIEVKGHLPMDAEKDARLLKIKTDDGSISVADGKDVSGISMIIKVPKATQELVIATVSGDVLMKNVSAKEFSFNTISGNLTAENSHFEKTNGITVSGDIEIESAISNEVKFESISGDVTLKLPPTQKSKFTLKSISGDIENTRASTEGAAEVRINTTSGDIKIE